MNSREKKIDNNSMARPSLSVSIITLNEEDIIERTLKSIKFADEIIVVDSGSSDRTVELAKQYTDSVTFQEWSGYAAQKNIAIDKCSEDWILPLDADESLEPTLVDEIKEIIASEDSKDGYYIPYKTFFLGKQIKHGGWAPGYKLRLFKKGKGRYQKRKVHESLNVAGEKSRTTNSILHYTVRDLATYAKTNDKYSTLAVKEMAQSGKLRGTALDIITRPLCAFIYKYFFRFGFLDGVHGFIINGCHAFYVFSKYSKAWEKKRRS